MTLTATEATRDHYYLRTEYTLDFRHHHGYTSESRKATKIVYICYGRDDIMIRDYHLLRHHFQETNWRMQSIDEIWIVRVFIKAGTHSTALSQYPSIPAKLLLLSGILTSPYGYGTDSELQMDLLDVPIAMYVVPNCRGFGPKPSNGRSVTVPVLPPNNILLSQPPLWTAQEQVDMWMLSSSGNMSVAREMLPR